jgi:hypothetical protein
VAVRVQPDERRSGPGEGRSNVEVTTTDTVSVGQTSDIATRPRRIAAHDAMRLVKRRLDAYGLQPQQVDGKPRWTSGCPVCGSKAPKVRWDQHDGGTVTVHPCQGGCEPVAILAALNIDDERVRVPNGQTDWNQFTRPGRGHRPPDPDAEPYELLVDRLREAGLIGYGGKGGKESPHGWVKAGCPACGAAGDGHGLKVVRGDAVRNNRTGRLVFLHCFNGCPPSEVLEALGLTWADLLAGDDVEDLSGDEEAAYVSGVTDDEKEPETKPVLEFTTLADLCARVDAAGPRRWLIRGIWPGGAYGVHAADMKAQKTWNALDLAVSTASGTNWLNAYPVDDPGPVVIFAGEGGEASIVRRIRAICASRELKAENLPITICTRAPHLGDAGHMLAFATHLEAVRPRLVLLDPLYLSLGGADGKDIYAMGRLLERPQILCNTLGTSLVVVTHFNRGQRTGAQRITGAGPAEWGRVLIGAEVKSRHTDPATRATTVITQLDVIGGEVPDHTFRVMRIIAAEEPDRLDSPLIYSVEVGDGDESNLPDWPPARRKLYEAVTALREPSTGKQLVDWVAAKYKHGLTRPTVSTEMNALLKDGLVDRIEQPGHETLWTLPQGVSGVGTTPTRHQTTGASEGVVAVVAYKATATPDTPDDTLGEMPGTDQCTVCARTPTRRYRDVGRRCVDHAPGPIQPPPGQVACIDCHTPMPAYQVDKRAGRCVSCHYRAGAA